MNGRFKLLQNAWIITLSSSVIGIFIGIYLTNFFAQRQLRKDKEKAIYQVLKEISENRQTLLQYHDTLRVKYEAFTYLIPYLHAETDGIVIHKDSLLTFKERTASIVQIEALEEVSPDRIRISGEADLTLNANSTIILTGLSDVIWQVYKTTDYFSITEFQCLTTLENLYGLQENFNLDNKTFIDQFLSKQFLTSEPGSYGFKDQWERMLLKQQALLNFFERIEAQETLSICHQ